MVPGSTTPKTTSEILTVMFIDMVGYTSTTARLNRESFSQLHDVFDTLAIPIFEKYTGTVVKKIGDAFLVTFKSPTDAVLCGIELQDTFGHYDNTKKPRYPIKIRVALHTGEVLLRNGDIYGDAVNTAARIEGIAGPEEIIFSEAVFLSMNKNEIPFVHLGTRKLKGLKYPVRMFRVKGKYDEIMRLRRLRRKKSRQIKLFFLTFITLLFLSGLALFALWYLWTYSNLFSGIKFV